MNKWQKNVRAFQRMFGFAHPRDLTLPTPELLYFRRRLVAEEANELVDALAEGDLAKIAGECVDLLYVTIGAAVSCGIDLAPHFRAVHAANMRKTPPARPGQKAQKLAGWQAPDHVAILCRSLDRCWWKPWSWFRKQG